MTTPGMGPFTHLLVVEGTSDHHAVVHFCRAASPGLESIFTRLEANGFQGVLGTVPINVNQEGMIAVGFVVDADDDPEEHWRQVISEIAEANNDIQLPQDPDINGTIIPEDPTIGSPRIGIWVMPDNTSAGELEDFVVQMIPGGDAVWPLSQDYIDGIPPDARKFDHNKIAKSQVHAWLAARKFPGLVGLAIREGDLVVNGHLSQRFLSWLTRLFR